MFEVLSDEPAGLPLGELRPRVRERVPPTSQEQVPGNNYLGGWTTAFVKAGWITKENGRWRVTNQGRAAHERFRDADPADLTAEATRLYRIAMGQISGRSLDRPRKSPAAPRSRRRAYAPHPDRDHRLASAVAIARFALESSDLYETHRNEVLSLTCWKATEADGKYKTRYRSSGARDASAGDLRHEHVVPRKALRDAMEREPERAAEILRDALACTVTKEEHDRLTALGNQHEGWDRYIAAGVDVFDEREGRPFIQSGRFVEPSR
jgi:hypothetical protein